MRVCVKTKAILQIMSTAWSSSVDVVIKKQQQTAIGQGLRDHLPKRFPQAIPGNLQGQESGLQND
jgi:hypothetical protein